MVELNKKSLLFRIKRFLAKWKVIDRNQAIQLNLKFHRNTHGDEINFLDCRSIWIDEDMNRYRVRQFEKSDIYNFQSDSVLELYDCIKVVKASKIVGYFDDIIVVSNSKNKIFHVKLNFNIFEKHDVEVGGYLVEYEDGYISYSPKKAFEKGYIIRKQ